MGGREDEARRTKDASNFGIQVDGNHDVAVRLAKCSARCRETTSRLRLT